MSIARTAAQIKLSGVSARKNGYTEDAVTSATTKEIMATTLACDLEDGEWVEVGANLPVPRAGVLSRTCGART
jgi:hypothetical protein